MPDAKNKNAVMPNHLVSFRYIFKDDYTPVYANGAYGGVTAHGEIVANFYLERHALPLKELVEVNGSRVQPDGCDRNYVRVVETGVVLSLETAKSISAWLDDKIKQAENIQNNKSNVARVTKEHENKK